MAPMPGRRIVRWAGATVVAVVLLAGLQVGATPAPAGAAGIVTHAWMALDAIDHVGDPGLRALLDAQRDQVRAGAEFPDGGYWTRTFGTPGGDYGEEAHWQRFIEAYVDRIRRDPSCGDLRNPAGPCAAKIAHAFGAAAHGMGDEVWDWLFEPNGPGFGEDYLPPEWAGLVGPGGLEAQLDVEVIARHGRPIGPTPEIPDPAGVVAAFAAVGRGDIRADALPIGEGMLDVEREVEAGWVESHAAAIGRAMPWTTEHVTASAGGVDFGALAVAGYYDGLWSRLLGARVPTRVSVVAPAPGLRRVPATGWVGNVGPGSHEGNRGGLTRIAAVLTSALPFNASAGGGPVAAELPADAFRLRVAATGVPVPARSGFPRIVPYNPEAGEHVVAWQPAADLVPCTWYRAEITEALVDARHRPVQPYRWEFRTSGCRGRFFAPVRGTVTCAMTTFVASDPSGAGGALTGIDRCEGGQDGRTRRRAKLPIASGVGVWDLRFGAGGCGAFAAGGSATIRGRIRWEDASHRVIGTSWIASQPYDLRGAKLLIDRRSRVLPGQVLALRLAVEPTPCQTSGTSKVITSAKGRATAWVRGS
jgi:hypothetical protein